MRGGWDDELSHAHLVMVVMGILVGALLIGVIWGLVS
jgi:hypothetical protein